MRNHFAYRNFLRFLVDFELKFREFFELNFHRNSLENLGTLEFDEIWSTSSLLHLIEGK
jgi:hypothetical protein